MICSSTNAIYWYELKRGFLNGKKLTLCRSANCFEAEIQSAQDKICFKLDECDAPQAHLNSKKANVETWSDNTAVFAVPSREGESMHKTLIWRGYATNCWWNKMQTRLQGDSGGLAVGLGRLGFEMRPHSG